MPKRQRTSSEPLRRQLAQEAARLIMEHGIDDYGQAKRKAADRLGVGAAGALPSNTEIESSLVERQRIFEADSHQDRLRTLRLLALDIMEILSSFQPRLAGPVLNGTATINSGIELHVFTDAPESVAQVLEENNIVFRDYQKRYRLNGLDWVSVPGFAFSREEKEVYALTFPEKGVRQPPLSPVDRRPMRRAARAQVLALVE